MPQKTIPDLQLIAEITDDLNFPSDNSIQSYRATAAQLAEYGIKKIADLTNVTPVLGDSIGISDLSDSGAAKRITVASLRNAVYRNATTTDAVGVDDETIKLSGASFTATLPTAVGVAGKRYKFVHAGTSVTQVYTFNTTSSQTIGGIASGALILTYNGDVLWIESDGANWLVLRMPLMKNFLYLDGGNGRGSTNTAVRRFTNNREFSGTAMTYADSSTNGMSVTINEPGLFAFTYGDYRTGGTADMTIKLNNTTGTLTYAAGMRAYATTVGANQGGFCQITLPLVAGDIIRAGCSTNMDGTIGTVFFSACMVNRL